MDKVEKPFLARFKDFILIMKSKTAVFRHFANSMVNFL